jgi:hypothetical protein
MFTFDIIDNLYEISLDGPIFVHVISTDDRLHGANSRPCFVYVRTLTSSQKFLIPIEHSEFTAVIHKKDVSNWLRKLGQHRFVLDKKKYLHYFGDKNARDINLMDFLATGKIIDPDEYDTVGHVEIKRRCFRFDNLNLSIPILKQVEKCDSIFNEALPIIKKYEGELNEKINYDFLVQLYRIESEGLCVDVEKVINVWGDHMNRHIKGNLIFTEYNNYIGTGRASNRFGGINYAALSGDKGEKEPFISRHKNGRLVMFDYSAFHPRLITTLIDYEIPFDVNIYDYLGQRYFKKDVLTPMELADAKELTFKIMYGGIPKEYMDIEYFKKIHTFSENLWSFFNKHGYIETPIFAKKIKKLHVPDPFSSKLFNYMLQAYESEVGSQVIGELQDYLRDKKTKLVMYQYDGFLFDFDPMDGKEVLSKIRDIMMMGKTFPLKIKAGKNFQDLVEITV